MMQSINPATGSSLKCFSLHSTASVEAALARVHNAQAEWCHSDIETRMNLLRALGRTLRGRKEEIARLITLEMGKPIVEAEAEVEKCAFNCDFYAEKAPEWLADLPVPETALESAVLFEPLGVILAIMPWNYPMWQVFRFLAPALAAGNGALLKHAANVPQCALIIEEIVRDAGCPAGLFRVLLIEADGVANLIGDSRIAAVTFTGSTEVGRIVATNAGQALKKQVLELGGSDPFIVLDDADLDKAADSAVRARFLNAGQSCVNAKRFIVLESVADRFVQLFAERAKALVMGDPLDRATEIGPLARENLRDDLDLQVRRTLDAGGLLCTGGRTVDRPGFFYEPTIIDRVEVNMAVFREETFGPVAAIVRARDEEEAVALANRTEFGLGASIWSRDLNRARAMARRIDAGAVFINAVVASDPRLPFGGIKQSGYGRELSQFGIREFVNVKALCIDAN